MGESFSRSVQSCWDPEGTADLVRKKKAQRAAINKYDELLKMAESGDTSAAGQIQAFDRENMNKGAGEFKGKFWDELQMHNDWPPIVERRRTLNI
mmetsp:Transcript_56241/g.100194  ORF Transcript_56241/g.100194 Transcript_56241/m.100194 type:complete len:95 (-) Transcript_56241:18-302(-)|eukprot:CAMPEP_0197661208 /NCGR_PEP_ID=MMETSP1338-20131121/51321_1 /TAXON_ID=43686 ORGANISM="Pelagodinium beii, Strain RCC1491" /NCGR_SAMPLE_ID=MMETSP1338 /ASSEMBLY_ACC=CAM_ASM_000754 /LENGTH=94 /DNA_ID=CAMNT_0043238723 /DNA_START=78 /DNA_END=362 /DNA_ORIENTATION=-